MRTVFLIPQKSGAYRNPAFHVQVARAPANSQIGQKAEGIGREAGSLRLEKVVFCVQIGGQLLLEAGRTLFECKSSELKERSSQALADEIDAVPD